MPIQSINLPGTDGYEDYHPGLIAKSGPWSEYPYAIHHHLAGSEIKCLHQMDKAGKGNAAIDKCFALSQSTKISNQQTNFFSMPLLRRSSEDVHLNACRGR